MPYDDAHLLDTLQLPSRYEPLVKLIGPEVLNLLVPPTRTTLDLLEEAGDAIGSLGEGLFAPVFAQPGTGKTTLVENLSVFLPGMFTKTLTYNGTLTSDDLATALSRFIRDDLQQNDQRVIPVNVDHREDRPPSREEMSEIKRFLRAGLGQRVLLAWPGTMLDTAERMAEDYRRISGVVPVVLPITVEGPPHDRWVPLAAQTLQLANQVDSLEHIIDLEEHDPHASPSLGDFLKQIAVDFNRRRLALKRATTKPLELTILVVSESSGHGILSSLTSSRRYGMLDPAALLQASGDSATGRWWAQHRGLLVQTIVTLDAHAFSVSPPLSLAAFRRYGPPDIVAALQELGFANRTPREVSTYLGRSDLGRHLAKEQRAVGEGRGNPAEEARGVFETLVEHGGGFQSGRDKKLNGAFAEAVRFHLDAQGVQSATVNSEKGLGYMPSLIPDISIETPEAAHCLEFTYRKGDFLTSQNRGTMARYCLDKLRNYARELGWISSGA